MGIYNYDSARLPDNLDTSKAEIENNLLFNSYKKRYDDTTELRRSLAILFTITIIVWLFMVFVTLIHNNYFKLSDSVLITLLTTTTIQVLGMMYIILKDLFPGGSEEDNRSKNE